MNLHKREWLPYLGAWAAVAVIVICLANVAVFLETQRYRERAQTATNNIAQLQSQNLANLFAKIDVALKAGAMFHLHQYSHNTLQEEALNSYLKHLESVMPEMDGIRILDQDGRVRYGHNIPLTQRTDLSDRAFFRKARDQNSSAEELVVDGPLFARIAQKWVIVFARRLSKPDGTFAGVIYANLGTAQLEQVLSLVALGPGGAATVRAADLSLVHRYPDTKNAVGSKNVSAELKSAVEARPQSGDYVAVTALDGVERSNAYQRVGNYPFYAIVGLATEDYVGNARQNSLVIVCLAAMTLLFSALASYRGYKAHQQTAAALREHNKLNDSLAKKAVEAEVANKAKTAFLSNMSHELRTPLHQITGMAHLIGKDPLTEKQSVRLQRLEGSVKHMTALVDAVLELTRIETSSLDLSEEPLDLPLLVADVVNHFRPEAEAKQLALTAADIPAIAGLAGAKHRIHQALMNYVSNAVRFTQSGGIVVRLLVLQDAPQHALLRVEVQDTGPGIAPQDQARLFTMFEQGDNTSTRRFNGLGVGLVLTRKIAEALGGEAGCHSAMGQGSTFWFTFQAKKHIPSGADGSASAPSAEPKA